MAVLWDGRGVISVVLNHNQMEEIIAATMRSNALGTGRSAWVTPPERKDIGMVGMLLSAKLDDGRERQGFTDYDEALAWVMQEELSA